MKKKDVVISVKVTPELKEALRVIAEAEYRSMSMQIELFLKQKIVEWENSRGHPATRNQKPRQ